MKDINWYKTMTRDIRKEMEGLRVKKQEQPKLKVNFKVSLDEIVKAFKRLRVQLNR